MLMRGKCKTHLYLGTSDSSRTLTVSARSFLKHLDGNKVFLSIELINPFNINLCFTYRQSIVFGDSSI